MINNIEQMLLEEELEQALLEIEIMVQPGYDECGINNIEEYFAQGCGPIEFDDDMDDIDRRNVEDFIFARNF